MVFAGVYQHGGFVHFTSPKIWQRLNATLYALVDGNTVVQGGFFEHPVDHLCLDARVAYTQAQAPVVVGAELGMA